MLMGDFTVFGFFFLFFLRWDITIKNVMNIVIFRKLKKSENHKKQNNFNDV